MAAAYQTNQVVLYFVIFTALFAVAAFSLAVRNYKEIDTDTTTGGGGGGGGELTGNLTGDVKATNGTVILNNGTDGTDAAFTGDVTGDVTGNVTGDLTGTAAIGKSGIYGSFADLNMTSGDVSFNLATVNNLTNVTGHATNTLNFTSLTVGQFIYIQVNNTSSLSVTFGGANATTLAANGTHVLSVVSTNNAVVLS